MSYYERTTKTMVSETFYRLWDLHEVNGVGDILCFRVLYRRQALYYGYTVRWAEQGFAALDTLDTPLLLIRRWLDLCCWVSLMT